jgi:hypothetical protein
LKRSAKASANRRRIKSPRSRKTRWPTRPVNCSPAKTGSPPYCGQPERVRLACYQQVTGQLRKPCAAAAIDTENRATVPVPPCGFNPSRSPRIKCWAGSFGRRRGLASCAADAACFSGRRRGLFVEKGFPRHGGSVSPAPRIAKGGSSEFRCFFCEGAKKDSRISCGAVPRKRVPLLQCAASAGRSLFCNVAIKRLKQRE